MTSTMDMRRNESEILSFFPIDLPLTISIGYYWISKSWIYQWQQKIENEKKKKLENTRYKKSRIGDGLGKG